MPDAGAGIIGLMVVSLMPRFTPRPRLRLAVLTSRGGAVLIVYGVVNALAHIGGQALFKSIGFCRADPTVECRDIARIGPARRTEE